MNVTDLPRRMQAKIRVSDTGCWIWTGAHSSNGYGSVGMNRVSYSTHRVTYEFLVGPIPDGLQIDHLCRQKSCCNPEHLEPVTQLENMRRRPDVNKSHCKHGHEMTEANTITKTRKGGLTIRNCRACVIQAQRDRRQRAKGDVPLRQWNRRAS